mgnify:FL=1
MLKSRVNAYRRTLLRDCFRTLEHVHVFHKTFQNVNQHDASVVIVRALNNGVKNTLSYTWLSVFTNIC